MSDSCDCLDRSDRMSLRSPDCPTDDFRNFVHGMILGFNADVESFAAYGIVEKLAGWRHHRQVSGKGQRHYLGESEHDYGCQVS